ncbi:VOC family protein [Streptomyces chiangmaiensis]|uniref:VOC family protein n=1 Tax=Streptomyces chiangmaiensis TaxID=766497 RepID=A0ABU7FFK8_9ACTN|nr:VOC family protein [Streptomyces chiangmaiensis]MED7822766.1 VOC family protein [Streptomyces chiangmaiensis]
MLIMGSVVLGVSDMRRAAALRMEALGHVPRDRIEDDWVVRVPPGRAAGPGLSLGPSETPVQEHPRVQGDLYTADAAQAAEVERLVGLGARHVEWDLYPEDPDFVVPADPDGNRFRVVDTGRGAEGP